MRIDARSQLGALAIELLEHEAKLCELAPSGSTCRCLSIGTKPFSLGFQTRDLAC
jgi:hypothetical protein